MNRSNGKPLPSVWVIITILSIVLLSQHQTHGQILTGPRSWSTLLRRAIDLSRSVKWNEFVEEQKSESTTKASIIVDNRNKSNQNLIDETKDPESPFYISMISSNIGGGNQGLSPNRSMLIKSKEQMNQSQTGLASKLFTYAFSSVPSRVLLTTKRPLITYINVSNLEEHDEREVR